MYTHKTNLANSFALHCQGFHLGEVMIVSCHIGNYRLFIRLIHIDILKKKNNMVNINIYMVFILYIL